MKIAPTRYVLFSGCAVDGGGSPARSAAIALARTLGIETLGGAGAGLLWGQGGSSRR